MKLPFSKKLIPAIKLVVFLLVAFGLLSAGKQAAERWETETSALEAEVRQLQQQAAIQTDSDASKTLAAEAERRESLLPSLANVRWNRVGWSALLYAAGLVPPAFVLRRCLTAFGISCSRRRVIAAQLLGHAGKYIPGKAMVVVLRVGAIRRTGVHGPSDAGLPPVGRVTTCVFFETLLMMGVGGAASGVLLWNSPLPVWVRVFAAVMAIGSLVPLCPPVLRRVIDRISARRERTTGDPSQPSGPSSDLTDGSPITWRLLGWSYVVSLASWVLIGSSFAVLITAIPSLQPTPPLLQLAPVATAAISLGMVIGFVSLLPGGAGVREYVTLLVLVPVIGQTHALLAVIAARLLFILVEAISAGIASIYLHSIRPPVHG